MANRDPLHDDDRTPDAPDEVIGKADEVDDDEFDDAEDAEDVDEEDDDEAE